MKLLAEYVWIGGNNEFRSKSKTIESSLSREDLAKNNMLSELLDPKKYTDFKYKKRN